MLSAGTTFLCVSLLCFSSLCILADDDKREAVREEARQVPKQDVEEESLEDRSAQIIRAQDAEEGAEKSWRDEDLGDVAEPSGIQESTQCLSPSPPDNGFIVGSYFREGAKVHVLCEDGYVLAGPSELTCIACTFCSGGIWSPEEKYSCKPRNPSLVEIRPLKEENETHPVYNIQETTPSCPPPKPPEHGYLQGRNYSLDASLHIVCDPGYTLTGQDHITCLRVPAPFKNVVAWQPFDMPRCQIMPPSLLPMGVKGGVSEMKGITSHRLTDTSPGTIPTEGLPHICFLPKVVGPCQLYLPRFYFDHSIEECTTFVYGGCGGNENNFESMDICQHKCR